MSRGELGPTQANLRGPRREPPRVEPSLPYTRHCVPYRVLTRSEMRERERERDSSQCVVIFLSLCIVGAWAWERRVREGYFWYFESFGWGRVLIAPRGLSAFVLRIYCKLSCNNFYKNIHVNALDRYLSKLIFKWKLIYQDWIFYQIITWHVYFTEVAANPCPNSYIWVVINLIYVIFKFPSIWFLSSNNKFNCTIKHKKYKLNLPISDSNKHKFQFSN